MSKFNKFLIFISLVLVLSSFVSIEKNLSVTQAASLDYDKAGTWAVTETVSANTISVSGQVYGSAVFEGVNCPYYPEPAPSQGGHGAASFGQLFYEIYNSSGQVVVSQTGDGLISISQWGNSCSSVDFFKATIHDISISVDISGLAPGDYSLYLSTGWQSTEFYTSWQPLYHSILFTKSSSCAISSFTCDPNNAGLAWATTNCSSRSISPTIGSVVATGNTPGTVGTTYTLTADSETSTAKCAAPILTTTGGGSRTVTPGQQTTLPSFNFNNTGESGSVIHYSGCEDNPVPTGGITIDYIDCPPAKDLIAP